MRVDIALFPCCVSETGTSSRTLMIARAQGLSCANYSTIQVKTAVSDHGVHQIDRQLAVRLRCSFIPVRPAAFGSYVTAVI